MFATARRCSHRIPGPLLRARPLANFEETIQSMKQVQIIKPSKPIQSSPPSKPTKKITPEIPKVKSSNISAK
jgi:hypothetical protein